MHRRLARLTEGLVVSFVVVTSSPALAQEHEVGGGSGGSGCGDLFGELVHVLRHPDTGQPILERRWVVEHERVPGWAYCPIPVDASGAEIPFAPESCDPAPERAADVVAVDYFGRLSAGRTKERNLRMHLDEVIAKIRLAERVDRDPSGRLAVGYDCDARGCTSWSVVDSPLENLGLYHRLLKYGHLQTDPLELEEGGHGEDAEGPPYHPALAPADYAKFQGAARALLPAESSCAAQGAACFAPQPLGATDLVLASAFLGGAADKRGRVTPDLVQYLNRILRITVATPVTAAAVDTLPALIRDCGDDPSSPIPAEQCTLVDADAYAAAHPEALPLPFPANERFVFFAAASYERKTWFGRTLEALRPSGQAFVIDGAVPLLGWLDYANPGGAAGAGMPGFVRATSDALRTAQFLHSYGVPEPLGWDFMPRRMR